MTVRNPLHALLAVTCATALAAAQTEATCTASATPFGVGCGGLTLGVSAPPCVPNTTPFHFQMAGIPVGTVLNVIIADFVGFTPGIDVGFLGMPGCTLFTNPTVYAMHAGTAATSPTDSFPSNAPPTFFNNTWLGVAVYAQAIAFVPGINPFGAVVSNGMLLIGG